jgi:hypothetical protein
VADAVPLSQVRVGSTLLLPCKLTAKGAGGVTLQPLADDRVTATGSIAITLAGAVSGNFTIDPRDQPVKVMAFALNVGDIVRELTSGVTAIVMATNVDGNPARWSPSTAGRPSYTTDGWEPIGTATLP